MTADELRDAARRLAEKAPALDPTTARRVAALFVQSRVALLNRKAGPVNATIGTGREARRASGEPTAA